MTRRQILTRCLAAVPLAAAAVAFADKPVSDDALHDMVKRRLANDADVKGGALDIEVHEGVVTLRGKVESEKQRKKAEKLAKKIKGVKRVVNEIQLSEK